MFSCLAHGAGADIGVSSSDALDCYIIHSTFLLLGKLLEIPIPECVSLATAVARYLIHIAKRWSADRAVRSWKRNDKRVFLFVHIRIAFKLETIYIELGSFMVAELLRSRPLD